ncbi:MAG: SUMF1/EgtB/PvdO family nonheme iron enzyme [Opitutales bacterium]|nr:SUMF1/EgtB/PvdO family nonheme iron enzyme [Opitutales bacterium]
MKLHILSFFSLLIFGLQAVNARIDFVRDVQPILEHNCVSCHREDNAKGDIRLDEKKFVFESEDLIIPGNAEDSSLYWTTTLPQDDELFMPPIKNVDKDYPLTNAEKIILKQWIEDGAAWPDGIVLETKKRLPKKISFVEDVQPILELSCVSCHYDGNVKGDLRLDSYEHAFESDHVIVPGKPLDSDLYVLCTLPQDDEMFMPPEGNDPLSSTDLFMLRRWIEEGADWPKDITLSPQKKSFTLLGMLPKDLYKELGFKSGEIQDDFSSYHQSIKTSDLDFEMMPIKGGEFSMGSQADDPERGEDEHIFHPVKVSDFWMGKYEVTWDEYELWMINLDKDNREYNKIESTPADELSDAVTKPTSPYTDMSFGMGKRGYPAICMTQLSAKMYCMWLSARTGKFYRLPTEAEWEYACKAGTNTVYSFGDDASELSNHAWHLGNSRFQYQKVGQKSPNPFGLYDMHGNVWEWVLDKFVPPSKTVRAEVLVDPLNLPDSLYSRTVKGGSWDDGSKSHRSAARLGSEESWKQQDPQIPKSVWYHTDALFVGFRVVRPRTIPNIDDIEMFWPSEEDISAIPSR